MRVSTDKISLSIVANDWKKDTMGFEDESCKENGHATKMLQYSVTELFVKNR